MCGLLRLNSLDSKLETMGMYRGDITFEATMENWLVAVNLKGGMPEAKSIFRGQLIIVRMKQ